MHRFFNPLSIFSIVVLIALEEKGAEVPEQVETSDFLVQLRVHHDVEVIIDLFDLNNVFILHLSSADAPLAGVLWFVEHDLVDDDVVNVYVELGQLHS